MPIRVHVVVAVAYVMQNANKHDAKSSVLLAMPFFCCPHEMSEASIELRNQNRMHVRKYYMAHRNEIIRQNIERSCRLHGCVPRIETILEHELPLTVLVDAFAEWLATRDPDDKKRARRSARFRRMVQQLENDANSRE